MKRTKRLVIRVTPREKTQIEENLSAYGMTATEFMRGILNGQLIPGRDLVNEMRRTTVALRNGDTSVAPHAVELLKKALDRVLRE